MKTHIVNIDPYEDFHSIRDKLSWVKSERVLLIWPGRSQALQDRLDLVLLKRYAQQRSLTLGFLTFDPTLRAYAEDLHIPIFDELENLPESNWKIWQPDELRSRPDRPLIDLERPGSSPVTFRSPANPLHRLVILLLPISTLLLALVLLLPTATITLAPPTLRELASISFTLDDSSDANLSNLPFERRELVLQGEKRIPTSGTRDSPAGFASGRVTFTNKSDEAVLLPAGVTVRSSNQPSIYYLTESEARLAAGAQRSLTVVCSSPGPEGNLEVGGIDTIDGPLGLSVSVGNNEAMTGGFFEQRSAVASSDLADLKEALEQELRSQFLTQISQSLGLEQRMLTLSYQRDEVIDEIFDGEPGDLADSLGLDMTLRLSIAVINIEDIDRLALEELQEQLTPGYLYTLDSPTILALRERLDDENGILVIETELVMRSYLSIDQQRIMQLAVGQSSQAFVDNLNEVYSVGLSPEVSITPPWWPRLPIFPYQITLELEVGET